MNGSTNPGRFNAPVGRIVQVTDNDETPEEWHNCDGAELRSIEWPEFVAAMGLSVQTFVLPKPLRSTGGRFIIKLGRRRVIPDRRPD